ncbi:indolepyruvate ferredoxin oxidoreductase, alpha subunit [Clostridium argentinense CDC 2741]|uniref:Indolepyruvate oxidoreductase subunit IorA n=1 Tax=Clostridium argentinense CDC 2741 TaxID=1418104 RepID=A0A0C1RB99_9CLOT|nr:indolepyruvate ferredoxin oxidoreductase subunit alpha [Clostridium argentinense]ARC84486.1 indolepyruvate ferredoxin oxidoreductase subunit alpha [Clostridium argentinense]KIE47701.1 indolepyruvate ferredoxin oxidoreductase, alpha subunit [Clostridium argentinense CDC 2741]NFF38731.1 indolepyruvate ferredoxin oxidoreductase subunit alpha [Clostridium argentinense]NFP48956.1 indolepyruvate ferredoxin oxidoreductase subunit alpha [Clostridium argentinense]NFP72587.1 indolepyruvate ferredoxin
MNKVIMTGNEAIARGAYEAGCHVASAYPGTPSTEILENFATYEGVYAEWAPNEKVGFEVAAGASIGGARALTTMKHVGLNVAADPLFTMAYEGVNGGFVVITADDPGMHSSQNEQDNRFYAPHAKVAMLEPSDSQECLDFMKKAYEISEEFDTLVLFRVTTRISHSKTIVEPGEKQEVAVKPYEKNIRKYIMTPGHAKLKHYEVEERLEKLRKYSNSCELNKIEMGDTKIGIITSGVSYQYCKEVFGDNVSYLKIGMSYPLPDEMIKKFSSKVENIYVVEENDPYLENAVKVLGINCKGKEIIPICDELNPDIIRKAILGDVNEVKYSVDVRPPSRPPVLCPGCPHRGIFYAVSKYKDVIAANDIGCYTLGMNAPLNVADTVICMGASISGGIGIERASIVAKREDKKVFSFIGDSTFFHSGVTGLINSVYNNTPIVTVILDNRITGMTGHQENPGTGKTLQNNPAPMIDLEDLVLACGVKKENIRVVDPYKLEETKKAVEEAHKSKEPFVIITKQPCALIKEVLKARADLSCRVNQDTCRKCKMCLKTGCPALKFQNGIVSIDESMCNGCELCKQVCPFKAIEKVGE